MCYNYINTYKLTNYTHIHKHIYTDIYWCRHKHTYILQYERMIRKVHNYMQSRYFGIVDDGKDIVLWPHFL